MQCSLIMGLDLYLDHRETEIDFSSGMKRFMLELNLIRVYRQK